MDYLHSRKHYEDLFDLATIRECLDYCDGVREGFVKSRVAGEFKKQTNRQFEFEVDKVISRMLYIMTGERYRVRLETINKWMDKDRGLQEKYDNAVVPYGIVCKDCGSRVELKHKTLINTYEESGQVLFSCECTKCGKRQAFYEDGTDWISVGLKCPKCNAALNTEYKEGEEILTTIESCTKCDYVNEEVMDFKKSRLEREEEKAKEQDLLNRYRKQFCITEKQGEEYLEAMEAMKVGDEIYHEMLGEYDNLAYQAVSQVKNLNIVGLKKLLVNELEKLQYVGIDFEKPEMGKQVVVPFSVQDSSTSRSEYESKSELKKILTKVLESTNWRLMSEGVSYRLGYLSGRLKGYEGEDALMELMSKKNKCEPKAVDIERREKYMNHNLVQLARVSGEIEGKTRARKRRLEKEPDGFPIPEGETFSCFVCMTHIDSDSGWYDKYGAKCLSCQRAVEEGIIAPVIFEESDSWYSIHHIESEYGIPEKVVKKLIKENVLKPRIVKDKEGKDHFYIFMAEENNPLLAAYKQDHRIVLLCGLPNSGQVELGEYLQSINNYKSLPIENSKWEDRIMRQVFEKDLKRKNSYRRFDKFVSYLHENYKNIAFCIDFSAEKIDLVKSLKHSGCEVIWLGCSIEVARERYLKQHGGASINVFDTLAKELEENEKRIVEELEPRVVDVLKSDNTMKSVEEIFEEFERVLVDYE